MEYRRGRIACSLLRDPRSFEGLLLGSALAHFRNLAAAALAHEDLIDGDFGVTVANTAEHASGHQDVLTGVNELLGLQPEVRKDVHPAGGHRLHCVTTVKGPWVWLVGERVPDDVGVEVCEPSIHVPAIE